MCGGVKGEKTDICNVFHNKDIFKKYKISAKKLIIFCSISKDDIDNFFSKTGIILSSWNNSNTGWLLKTRIVTISGHNLGQNVPTWDPCGCHSEKDAWVFYSENVCFLSIARKNSEKNGPSTTYTTVLVLLFLECTLNTIRSCTLNAKDREMGKLSPFLVASAPLDGSVQKKNLFYSINSEWDDVLKFKWCYSSRNQEVLIVYLW